MRKISQEWLAVGCTAPFIIGIAVAGNIWTFHRITDKDVCESRKNENHVPEEWFRIDTLTDQGRLEGVRAAVHIASLLKFFAKVVPPRTLQFGKKTFRNRSTILITTDATNGLHVKKWYVSYIQCLIYQCMQ